ncbi:MAG: hypothetical protein JWM10_1050 [Myxococcaceae bacterium]|nr:hypothetical protein [Myxococcaceae bacterium]
MVTRKLAAASLLLGLGLSCSREEVVQPTALFVVIDADPGVRSRSGSVLVIVRPTPAVGGAELSRHEFRVGGAGWPLTFVVQAADPNQHIEVYAEVLPMAMGAGGPVSVARALTGYVAHSTRVLPMMFWGGCQPDTCMSMQTCQRAVTTMPATMGDCESAIVVPTQSYSAANGYGDCLTGRYRVGNDCRNYGPPPPDGGGMGDAAVSDVPAAVDAPSADLPADTDAGSGVPRDDVPVDAGTDAGTDTGTDAGFAIDTGLSLPDF